MGLTASTPKESIRHGRHADLARPHCTRPRKDAARPGPVQGTRNYRRDGAWHPAGRVLRIVVSWNVHNPYAPSLCAVCALDLQEARGICSRFGRCCHTGSGCRARSYRPTAVQRRSRRHDRRPRREFARAAPEFRLLGLPRPLGNLSAPAEPELVPHSFRAAGQPASARRRYRRSRRRRTPPTKLASPNARPATAVSRWHLVRADAVRGGIFFRGASRNAVLALFSLGWHARASTHPPTDISGWTVPHTMRPKTSSAPSSLPAGFPFTSKECRCFTTFSWQSAAT